MGDEALAIPRLSMAGASAILLDAAGPAFDAEIQRRIWAVAAAIANELGIAEAVPGMNNLLVVFDPLTLSPETAERHLLHLWQTTPPTSVAGRDIDVPVVYGGARGEDLSSLAAHAGLTMREVVHLHAEPVYTVAAIGALPGFAFLSGLDPRISRARRPTPKLNAPPGAVMIGGGQAGINPCFAPTGWHIIGMTSISMFDPSKTPPATFRIGDRIRFRIVEIES
jgi:KipI family sensor histidine kinase inhibitor